MTNAPDNAPRLEWTLGDRLGKSLRISGISNADMAAALGVSRNTISNYIGDKTPIRDLYLKEWALKTGVPFEELKYGHTHTNGPTPPGQLPEKITFRSLADESNVLHFPTPGTEPLAAVS